MPKYLLALTMIIATLHAHAQQMTLGQLQERNATQLSADQLRKLLPGAKVTNKSVTGSTQRWTNELDGSLVASTDMAGSVGATAGATARGTWEIDDRAMYCVKIEWRTRPTRWCHHVYRLDDTYYRVSAKGSADTRAFELAFSR